MKRILFISHHLNRAGTEAFMMGIFRGIDHNRFHIDFLVYNQELTDFTREVEAAGSKVWRVPSRRESPWGWYCSLNRFFKLHASEYTAIHYNGSGLTAIAPIIFAYKYGIPIRICHAHSSSSKGFHNRLLHNLQRGLAQRLTTHHFACSSLAANWFYRNSPAIIIRNGIDTKCFAFNLHVREEVRQELQILPSTTVLGHVGRFEAEKNHTFLLDVFSEYLRFNADAVLMLIGIGSLMEAMKQKAESLGITDKVLMMGERNDVPRLLQAMDLFLMPSTFEGQPFVLIEAQCSGLPCLVSDVINSDICLTNNIETFPISKQPSAWAEEMKSLLEHYHRKSEQETIEAQGYSISDTINYLEKVYNGEA